MSRLLTSVLLSLAVIFLLLGNPAIAQNRICNPFTTTPDPGMLGLGTQVTFTYNQAQQTGTISAYYIASCFPGAPVLGLDAQAYVITWASPDGSQAVINGSALQAVDNAGQVADVATAEPMPCQRSQCHVPTLPVYPCRPGPCIYQPPTKPTTG